MQSLYRTTVQFQDLARRYPARNDVVKQDGLELLFVLRLKKRLDRAGRKFSEGFVGWREDRERSRTLERIDKASRFQRCRQRFELTRPDGRLNDVHRLDQAFRYLGARRLGHYSESR